MGILEFFRSNLRYSKIAMALSGLGRPRYQPSIVVDSEGIGLVLDPSTIETFADCYWSEISTIIAFKRDLSTVDLLCLRFEPVSGEALEVNEKMTGWSALLEALPAYLPGCMTKQQVLAAIVKPAFGTNETKMYSRQ